MTVGRIYEGPAGAEPDERQGPSARSALQELRKSVQEPKVTVPELSESHRQVLDAVKQGSIPQGQVSTGQFQIEADPEMRQAEGTGHTRHQLRGARVSGATGTPYRVSTPSQADHLQEGEEVSDIWRYRVASGGGRDAPIRNITEIIPGHGVVFLTSNDEEVFVPVDRLRGETRSAEGEINRQRRNAQRSIQRLPIGQARESTRGDLSQDQPSRSVADIMAAAQDAHTNDALNYVVDHGPYSTQEHIVSDDDIYRASEIDYERLSQGTEFVSGNREGLDFQVFEDVDGNLSSFIWAPEGVINVTGHPNWTPRSSGKAWQ